MSVPAARIRARWFSDRSIVVKIGVSVVVLVLVAVTLAVLAVSRLGALTDTAEKMTRDNVGALVSLSDIQRSFQGDRARHNQYVLADQQTRATLKQELAERQDTIQGQLDAYAEVTVNLEAFNEFRDQVDAYYATADQVVAAADAGNNAVASAVLLGELSDTVSEIMDQY